MYQHAREKRFATILSGISGTILFRRVREYQYVQEGSLAGIHMQVVSGKRKTSANTRQNHLSGASYRMYLGALSATIGVDER